MRTSAASYASNTASQPVPPSVHTRPTCVGSAPRAAASNVKVTLPLPKSASQVPSTLVHLSSTVPSSPSTESMSALPKLALSVLLSDVTPGVLSRWSSKSSKWEYAGNATPLKGAVRARQVRNRLEHPVGENLRGVGGVRRVDDGSGRVGRGTCAVDG